MSVVFWSKKSGRWGHQIKHCCFVLLKEDNRDLKSNSVVLFCLRRQPGQQIKCPPLVSNLSECWLNKTISKLLNWIRKIFLGFFLSLISYLHICTCLGLFLALLYSANPVIGNNSPICWWFTFCKPSLPVENRFHHIANGSEDNAKIDREWLTNEQWERERMTHQIKSLQWEWERENDSPNEVFAVATEGRMLEEPWDELVILHLKMS